MLVVWHAKKGEGKNCVQLHQGGVVRLSCFYCYHVFFFFFSSRRRHTRFDCDWSSDVCSSDLKRKVLYAIERVGYTPNIHARNLASGQSRTLGLIISDITNPFFPDLVKSIQERDRKSTRLNSSHSQISYAVFCLKKKKQTKDSP